MAGIPANHQVVPGWGNRHCQVNFLELLKPA